MMQLNKCSDCGVLYLSPTFVVAPRGSKATFKNSIYSTTCPNGHINLLSLNGEYEVDEFGIFQLISNTKIGKDLNKIESIVNSAKNINILDEDSIKEYLDDFKEIEGFDEILSKFNFNNVKLAFIMFITALGAYLLWMTFQTQSKIDIKVPRRIERIK
ncbi:hypothetical protein [Sphingobacterium paramultivorum]|uniref:hypothetical protein n=1 Tax=Sphingobacterium paramultivorum TaxID=2886510 RepID=UPI00129C835F|nr:hypothetical protein [Sphingobacterium paramultivorum]